MIRLMKNIKPMYWVLFIVLLFFMVIQTYFDVALPMYTANIITEMTSPSASFFSILDIGLVMLLFALASVIATTIQSLISAYIATGFATDLRFKLFKKVISFSHQEMITFSTPSLITRTTNDVQQVTGAINLSMRLAFSAPLIALLALSKIRAYSSELTITTGIGVFVMLTGILSVLMIVTPRFKIMQKLTDKINGLTRENLTGLRVIKAYNADGFHKNRFDEANENLTSTNLFTNRVLSLIHPLIMTINSLLTVVIYWIGAYIINRDKDPEFFATLFSFSQLSMQVVMAFMMLLMLLLMVPRARVSATRINEVLMTKPTVKDPQVSQAFKTEGEIEFKNVSFKYPGSSTNMLSNINFKINKGETLAIVGQTGSGKTTLINLILRFFDVTEGEVLVNGVNIKNVKKEDLYNIIGYVPQKSVLFAGTVTDNIAYGKPGLEQEKVEQAAKIACADEFISEMADGYDSTISQGGKNISGGQKQRLSIARAVATDPEIFIFDDSFSALDYKTDAKVRSNLKVYAREATKVIVAQRIGTIIDADKIIVLENGNMVGFGNHKQLLNECQTYKEIALSQLSKEELGLW